ncbi:MAG: CarD family transcriptional regulator [Oscillospiraceae bacterium]|nr:CarD family transcriptional regulator [Oscillospiraceae bacterium]
MYRVGDLIQYGRTGVCVVEEISEDSPIVSAPPARYYHLRPLYQNCRIRTPVSGGKVSIRPIISREDAETLISRIPELEAKPYYNRNLNQLREHYRSSLENCACEDLVTLTKSLYLKKQEAEAQHRKFGVVDERFMHEAEDLLYGELAAALEIERSDVEKYIAKRLEND